MNDRHPPTTAQHNLLSLKSSKPPEMPYLRLETGYLLSSLEVRYEML